MDSIFIKCSSCDRSTGLLLKVKTVKEMSTKFVLNTKLNHVGLSWIISSSKQIKYEIKENNHPDWLNKGQRYNPDIMLVINSFITMMKLDKNILGSYETVLQKIPTITPKPLSHDKKDQLLLTDIVYAGYLTHLAAGDYFFVNQKTQIFFTSEG